MSTKLAFQRNLRDAALLKTFALPAAASTATTSAALDTGERTAAGSFEDQVEAVLKIPDLSTTILPNTRTATCVIESSATSNFSSTTTLGTVVMTGAGGAGASAATLRVPLGPNVERYIRAKVTFGASTTDGSAVSAELSFVF